jgi:hypothetical protein
MASCPAHAAFGRTNGTAGNEVSTNLLTWVCPNKYVPHKCDFNGEKLDFEVPNSWTNPYMAKSIIKLTRFAQPWKFWAGIGIDCGAYHILCHILHPTPAGFKARKPHLSEQLNWLMCFLIPGPDCQGIGLTPCLRPSRCAPCWASEGPLWHVGKTSASVDCPSRARFEDPGGARSYPLNPQWDPFRSAGELVLSCLPQADVAPLCRGQRCMLHPCCTDPWNGTDSTVPYEPSLERLATLPMCGQRCTRCPYGNAWNARICTFW